MLAEYTSIPVQVTRVKRRRPKDIKALVPIFSAIFLAGYVFTALAFFSHQSDTLPWMIAGTLPWFVAAVIGQTRRAGKARRSATVAAEGASSEPVTVRSGRLTADGLCVGSDRPIPWKRLRIDGNGSKAPHAQTEDHYSVRLRKKSDAKEDNISLGFAFVLIGGASPVFEFCLFLQAYHATGLRWDVLAIFFTFLSCVIYFGFTLVTIALFWDEMMHGSQLTVSVNTGDVSLEDWQTVLATVQPS